MRNETAINVIKNIVNVDVEEQKNSLLIRRKRLENLMDSDEKNSRKLIAE
jgi:hypothetical protein